MRAECIPGNRLEINDADFCCCFEGYDVSFEVLRTMSRVCRAFFFMVKQFSLGCLRLKLIVLRSFETQANTSSKTRRHVPEDLSLQFVTHMQMAIELALNVRCALLTDMELEFVAEVKNCRTDVVMGIVRGVAGRRDQQSPRASKQYV